MSHHRNQVCTVGGIVCLTDLENLSSGENLAGCADIVRLPSAVIFLRVYILLPSGLSVYIRCIV